MSKILATSSLCGPCSMLKSKIAKLGLIVETKEHSKETADWFKKHQIRTVPKLVIEEGDTVEIIQGMDDIIEAIKNR
jgi:glutaredoxin